MVRDGASNSISALVKKLSRDNTETLAPCGTIKRENACASKDRKQNLTKK